MKKINKQQGSVTIILIIIILFTVGFGSYFYLENKKTSKILDTKSELASTTTEMVDKEKIKSESESKNENKKISSDSIKNMVKKELIDQTVSSVKEQVELPLELTKNISWISIEGTEDSILYKYKVKKFEEGVTNESIKTNLVSELCTDPEIRDGLLSEGVNLDYIYTLDNSTKTYKASINESDCI